MSTQIYYAINDSLKHAFMLHKSITSLRRYNKTIQVRVYVYAGTAFQEELWKSLAKLDVEILHSFAMDVHPTQLKWQPLDRQTVDTVVFLDADTYFHDDIEVLLRENIVQDFYAREEVGTEKHGKNYLLGALPIRPQLQRSAFRKLCDAHQSQAETVFNTGVMIFNRASYRQVDTKLIDSIGSDLRKGSLFAFLTTNEHIIEELAAAIALGKAGFTTGLLPADTVPFFVEGDLSKRRVVTHTWSMYYPFFLAAMEGVEVAKQMPGADAYLLESV